MIHSLGAMRHPVPKIDGWIAVRPITLDMKTKLTIG